MTENGEANTLREAVRLAVELQLGRERVELDDRLVEDLEADSFDLMSIVVRLEEDLGVHINEESAAAVQTVDDLVHLVASLRRA